MKVRVFYPNKDGKITFTKAELEKLLDEVYKEGRADGYSQGYHDGKPVTITYPYTPIWYSTTSDINTITCNDNSTLTSTNMTLQMGNASNAITIGDEQ